MSSSRKRKNIIKISVTGGRLKNNPPHVKGLKELRRIALNVKFFIFLGPKGKIGSKLKRKSNLKLVLSKRNKFYGLKPKQNCEKSKFKMLNKCMLKHYVIIIDKRIKYFTKYSCICIHMDVLVHICFKLKQKYQYIYIFFLLFFK